MKYVVTGGAGFIGSYIVKFLINEGHSVEVIDNLYNGSKNNLKKILGEINFHQIDIRNKQKIKKIMKNCDGVFHEAALTSVSKSFEMSKEYFDVNVKGTEIIFDVAKKENLKVIYASSASVYGNVNNIPIKEDFQKNPTNPYGKTKLEVEALANRKCDDGLEAIGLRYFNVYGKGQTSSYAGVITKFIENIDLNKPLTINGDGNQIRDFIHIDDIVKANIAAMKSKSKCGFFNVGSGIGTTINDLSNIIMQITKFKKKSIHVPSLDGDVNISQADVKSILSNLGWYAKIDLRRGLEKLIKSS